MIRYYCDWCGKEVKNLYSVTLVDESTIGLFGSKLSKATAHVCETCRGEFISEFKRKSSLLMEDD